MRNRAEAEQELDVVAGVISKVSTDVKTLRDTTQDAFDKVQTMQGEHGARLLAVEQLVAKMDGEGRGVPVADLQTATPSSLFINGRQVPVVASADRVANYYPRADYGEEEFTLSNYVRASMGIERPRFAVTTGPAIVPTYLGGQIIDAVRAESAVIQAGASTLPLDGKTNLCRIDGDCTVYQHTEGLDDISESVPVFSLAELNPKALVALIPLTHEVVSDSPNLDAALRTSIAAAMALKLDELSLATIMGDINIPASVTGQNVASWQGVMSAVGSAMAIDQKVPLAHISHPVDFVARNSEYSANFGWLSRPDLLKNMLEVASTGMTQGFAAMGNFGAGFSIGVRADLQIEVIRWSKATSYTHVLVAHMRADGYVLQPGQLFIQQTTTSGL